MAIKTTLVIADLHIPFHHVGAYRLLIKLIKDIRPNRLIILGDFIDAYNWSRFPKIPEFDASVLEAECSMPIRILEELRGLLGNWCEIVYLKGNHSHRIHQLARDRAPMLSRFIKSFSEIYHLSELNISLIEYGRDQLYQIEGCELYCRHEPFSGSGKHPARASLDEIGKSFIYGHTHKAQHASKMMLFEEIHAYCFGWLGDGDCREVFGYEKRHVANLGCGLVHTFDSGRQFFIEPLPFKKIENKLATYCGGKLYEV